MARTKAITIEGIAKDLNPKDIFGLKGHGSEPKVLEQPTLEKRSFVLGQAFNWYNYFCSNKEAKQFIVDYLIQIEDTSAAKKLNRVPDSKIISTYGWLARFSRRGLVLLDEEKTRLLKQINKMIESQILEPTLEEEAEKVEVEETNKVNIQTVMRERASDVSGELQGYLDEYIKAGCKPNVDYTSKVVNQLSEKNILPQHISIVLEPWTKIKEEIVEVQKGEDEQLNEGYSHLTKIQVRNIIKFIDQIIGNINSYVTLKQTTKAKRVRKPISVEKQVSKLKYLRKFKDDAAKIDLISIEPTKLHNSQEAWVYDTAKRRLYHYIADEMSKCLLVKGNTLLGFDAKQSEVKTLRKPAEQLKQIMGSKPAARKFFKEIKAVATQPNGRFNDAMIILKAF
jgi:hypothetical protein